MASQIIEQIRTQLIDGADESIRTSGQRFFKEEVKTYGFKTPVVSKMSKEYFRKLENPSKAEVFRLCEELWQSGYLEESFIACNWSYFIHDQYEASDIEVFARWIEDYVSNWASCDTLCNHSVGALVEMYPDTAIPYLKRWALSDNRWMRRAAAVSLIIPAKEGKFLEDIFEIADILLLDKDDLVQKGYGWMLKEASRQHQTEVYDYVMNNKKAMPRTALRYAIEKMPPELRKSAMAK